jgi:putative transcriptional regulator
MIPLRAGCLLLARPLLDDPHFVRSVVLILAHQDTEGTTGVILNRPGSPVNTPTHTPISQWIDTATGPQVDFYGGPVAPESFICLSQDLDSPVGIGFLDMVDDLDIRTHFPHRVFRGYSGWGPYQLDDEISQGAWWIVESHIDDVVDLEPENLWNKILQRQNSVLRRLGNFPQDPSDN